MRSEFFDVGDNQRYVNLALVEHISYGRNHDHNPVTFYFAGDRAVTIELDDRRLQDLLSRLASR